MRNANNHADSQLTALEAANDAGRAAAIALIETKFEVFTADDLFEFSAGMIAGAAAAMALRASPEAAALSMRVMAQALLAADQETASKV